MIIRFSIENFLSFAAKQTLDLTAVSTCKERLEENTFEFDNESLLKSAVIYGANASGKSNLIHALQFFCQFVRSSSKDSMSSEEIPVIPFLLNQWSKEEPSKFEIEFICDEKKFRYGFHATKQMIIREWLYEQGKLAFVRAFDGEDDTIQVENIWKTAHGLEERTRKNALFLSVCAQFAVPEAEKILGYFAAKLHVISGESPNLFRNYTCNQVHSGEYRNDILDFLRNADTHIVDLTVDKRERENSVLPSRKYFDIKSHHNIYDKSGQIVGQVQLPFDGLESLGTKKAFALAGPIIDTLKTGSVLIVDELDSRLHPIFTRQIVKLFNSCKTNPLNAQLVFNTHDTNLLSYKLYDEKADKDEYMFRRDQIYFAEKDNVEATHIYSLIEFKKKDDKKVRNDASFEKDYLNGIYGAIPYIGELISLPDGEEK